MKDYKFPTIEELLEAGVHFGHSVNKWHPKMAPYIYASRQGSHIIDLDQTEKLLREASYYLHDVASKGGQIVFVCTKKQLSQIAKEQAQRCGAMYVTERWIGGTITNYDVIKKNLDELSSLRRKMDSGEFSMFTKKERALIDREIKRLEKLFSGIHSLRSEPQAVVVVDVRKEKTAVKECLKYDVPVVGIVDTNSDPTGLTKVIPANDDAAKSVHKILSVLADFIKAGYEEYQKIISSNSQLVSQSRQSQQEDKKDKEGEENKAYEVNKEVQELEAQTKGNEYKEKGQDVKGEKPAPKTLRGKKKSETQETNKNNVDEMKEEKPKVSKARKSASKKLTSN